MSKRDTLISLLQGYREAECTLLHSGEGSGGNVPMMSKSWNHSYRELERCLHILSEERPKQTRMLLARYVDATQTRKRLPGRRNGRGELVFTPGPHREVRSWAKLPDADRGFNEWDVTVVQWPEWVRMPLVNAALDRLVEVFRGEPMLPGDFASLESVEDVRHRRVEGKVAA